MIIQIHEFMYSIHMACAKSAHIIDETSAWCTCLLKLSKLSLQMVFHTQQTWIFHTVIQDIVFIKLETMNSH